MSEVPDRVEQGISNDQISINARKVLKRLQEEGYEAYLVGGGVRDLLLGRHPKDFDVATSALPDEVRELFRNSRSIGRRFKIVHVRFGREIVEVATFRGQAAASQTESGMLLSDNVYGSFSEDVQRRDFTVNALYYDPEHAEVRDEAGGLTDLRNRTLRLIGDPESRYREDPVRMLRAVRFAARLDFEIDPASEKPIRHLAFLIQDIPPARLFEETLKLFMNGDGERCFELFRTYELFDWMFPASKRAATEPDALKLMELALASTDSRIAEGKSVTPAFILAAFLWHPFLEEKAKLEEEGMPVYDATWEASGNVIANQQLFTSIPRRFSSTMREIWQMQYRLPNRAGKKAEAIAGHRRFRAAYDFLLLREEAGAETDGLGAWWTEWQELLPDEQAALVGKVSGASKPRRRRRRKRKQGPTDPTPSN